MKCFYRLFPPPEKCLIYDLGMTYFHAPGLKWKSHEAVRQIDARPHSIPLPSEPPDSIRVDPSAPRRKNA